MTIMIMRQRKAKSIIVLFSVSTQALDTITGLWQTLPDLLVPRLVNVIKMVTLVTSFILIILLILVIMLCPPWSS